MIDIKELRIGNLVSLIEKKAPIPKLSDKEMSELNFEEQLIAAENEINDGLFQPLSATAIKILIYEMKVSIESITEKVHKDHSGHQYSDKIINDDFDSAMRMIEEKLRLEKKKENYEIYQNIKRNREFEKLCGSNASVLKIEENCVFIQKSILYEIPKEDIFPILLTEEILLKCGFVKNKSSNVYYYKRYPTIELDESFNLNKSFYIIDIDNKIYSLHQLQNIFFDLTGEELEVNL